MKRARIAMAGLIAASVGAGTVHAAPSLNPPAALTVGSQLYQAACAYCHGVQGQGNVRLSAPRLWGPGNAVSGSAYGSLTSLTQFITHNMPLEPVNGINPGSLSPMQAKSLAQYILHQGG
jgi:cytochrome c